MARRCGVIRTRVVERRTTLMLVRFRYHIITHRSDQSPQPLLAEDCRIVGFTDSPASAEWIHEDAAEALLRTMPDENVNPDQARDFIGRVVDGCEHLEEHIDKVLGRGLAKVLADMERTMDRWERAIELATRIPRACVRA